MDGINHFGHVPWNADFWSYFEHLWTKTGLFCLFAFVFCLCLSFSVCQFDVNHAYWRAIVGFFVNGMFAGYGAMITRLYPHHIRSTANNLILNVGRAVGGFSSVIIGSILDAYGVSMVMLFLSLLYLISFVALWTIKNVKAERYQALTK